MPIEIILPKKNSQPCHICAFRTLYYEKYYIFILFSALLTMPKPLTVWITINCWKFWKRWEYQTTWPASWETCNAGQEATVRTGHITTDWLQIGKGVHQDCVLSPCLFNLYAESIVRNAVLEEAQAGIKIAGRNIKKPQICRWHHPYGRKWRGTKQPLDGSEGGEW